MGPSPSSAYIFSPPSRYPFAATYRDACKDRQAGNLDISTRFRKLDTSVIAGENDTTAEDIYRSLAYDAADDEPDIAAIIMVDDVVAGGKTAIAALSHLTEAGLLLDADITVASLLRLNPT
jgi:pyrimidine operon attenuation protein/uracil phosphoribosyltransferase